jgi:hypothetical protein
MLSPLDIAPPTVRFGVDLDPCQPKLEHKSRGTTSLVVSHQPNHISRKRVAP